MAEHASEETSGPRSQNSPPNPTAPTVKARRAGEIVVGPRAGRSLGRLYKLEEEIAALPGVGDAMVHVLDDGHVLITVPPHAEARVREFLAMAGEV